jgi:hypothetical protein
LQADVGDIAGAGLLGVDAASLLRPGSPYGGLLEGFVLMEIARQLTWSRLVALEVKASSTVRGEDFRGLRHLAERLGDDLIVGVVLFHCWTVRSDHLLSDLLS